MPHDEPTNDERALDEVRFELLRKINDLNEMWRDCRQPRCRRQRRCCAASLCTVKLPPLTPEESAAVALDIEQTLEQALAERQGEGRNG